MYRTFFSPDVYKRQHLDAGEREYSIYYRVIEHDGSVRWKSLVFSYFGSDTSTLLAAARDIQAIQDTKLKERIANQTLEVALERLSLIHI